MIAIAHLPDKSSVADPLPVSMLKGVSNLLTPFLTHLFTSCFPASFKDSFLTLVLRKPGLDEASPSSYRPISNLSIISKLLHRLIVQQFVAYLNASRLLPATQSGVRRGHSTETAIIRVLSDLLDAVDHDDTAILVLLDLSAAFDTMGHRILLERLRVSLWRRQLSTGVVPLLPVCSSKCSDLVDVICSVPQGSVLGPILFIIYTTDFKSIISEHGLWLRQYADDSHYGSCRPLAVSTLSASNSTLIRPK